MSLFQKVYPGAKNDTFLIQWAPYYLNPTASTESITIEERMGSRVGFDQSQKFKDILLRTGTGEGIGFKFGGGIGNTRDSHRLIAMARKKDLETQGRVVEELFRGLFEEEQDITSQDFLIQAAKSAGLDEDTVRKGLLSNDCGEEVDEEVKLAKRKNIKGVPHFIINEQRELSGTQDPSEWMEVFTAIKESEAAS